MKKLLVLIAVVCGLSLGCQPASPPADSGTAPPSGTAPDAGAEHDHSEDEAVDDTEEDAAE